MFALLTIVHTIVLTASEGLSRGMNGERASAARSNRDEVAADAGIASFMILPRGKFVPYKIEHPSNSIRGPKKPNSKLYFFSLPISTASRCGVNREPPSFLLTPPQPGPSLVRPDLLDASALSGRRIIFNVFTRSSILPRRGVEIVPTRNPLA